MITKSFDYALRSLVYMTARPEQKYFGVKELSENLNVSKTYLAKILQDLVPEGYLDSVTGPGGGFGLARPSEKISLFDLLRTTGNVVNLEEKCFLGLSECSDKNPCPVHDVWSANRKQILTSFRRTSVADAAQRSWPQYRPSTRKKKNQIPPS